MFSVEFFFFSSTNTSSPSTKGKHISLLISKLVFLIWSTVGASLIPQLSDRPGSLPPTSLPVVTCKHTGVICHETRTL